MDASCCSGLHAPRAATADTTDAAEQQHDEWRCAYCYRPLRVLACVTAACGHGFHIECAETLRIGVRGRGLECPECADADESGAPSEPAAAAGDDGALWRTFWNAEEAAASQLLSDASSSADGAGGGVGGGVLTTADAAAWRRVSRLELRRDELAATAEQARVALQSERAAAARMGSRETGLRRDIACARAELERCRERSMRAVVAHGAARCHAALLKSRGELEVRQVLRDLHTEHGHALKELFCVQQLVLGRMQAHYATRLQRLRATQDKARRKEQSSSSAASRLTSAASYGHHHRAGGPGSGASGLRCGVESSSRGLGTSRLGLGGGFRPTSFRAEPTAAAAGGAHRSSFSSSFAEPAPPPPYAADGAAASAPPTPDGAATSFLTLAAVDSLADLGALTDRRPPTLAAEATARMPSAASISRRPGGSSSTAHHRAMPSAAAGGWQRSGSSVSAAPHASSLHAARTFMASAAVPLPTRAQPHAHAPSIAAAATTIGATTTTNTTVDDRPAVDRAPLRTLQAVPRWAQPQASDSSQGNTSVTAEAPQRTKGVALKRSGAGGGGAASKSKKRRAGGGAGSAGQMLTMRSFFNAHGEA